MERIPKSQELQRVSAARPLVYPVDWREDRLYRRMQKKQVRDAGQWNEKEVMYTADLGTAKLAKEMVEAAPTRRFAQIDTDVARVVRDTDEYFLGSVWHEFDVLEELDDRFTACGYVVYWEKRAGDGHIQLTVSW